MEIKAILKLNSLNWTLTIRDFDSAIAQAHNNRGLPVLAPSMRGIRMILDNMTYADIFHEWAREPLLKESGEIIFYDSFQQKISHRVCFQEAAGASFRIFFDKQSSKVSVYEVVLSVASKNLTIELGAAEEEEASEPIGQVDDECVIGEIYYLDEKGKRMDGLREGKITMVIEAENGTGEVIDIDLSDKKHKIYYNGSWPDDNLLRDIKLQGNVTKVKLEAHRLDAEG